MASPVSTSRVASRDRWSSEAACSLTAFTARMNTADSRTTTQLEKISRSRSSDGGSNRITTAGDRTAMASVTRRHREIGRTDVGWASLSSHIDGLQGG